MNRHQLARAAGVAVAVLVASGCSSGTAADSADTSASTATSENAPPSAEADDAWLDPQGHVEPILTDTDTSDPVEVGRSVAEIACTWSPVIDLTETAGLLRATPLLTPEYASSIVEPARGASQAIFVQAATSKAVSSPTAQQRTDIVDAPPATDTTQYLAYAVTWDWTAADQTVIHIDDPRIRTVYVVLQKQPGGTWLAANVDYQDQQAAE